MKKVCVLAALSLAVACTDRKTPTAPTPIAAPAPPLAVPSLPTTVPGVLSLSLPLDGSDYESAFGITPFGYHGGDHALDGHTGWDIGYRAGGIVRAAAAGTVESLIADSPTPGRFTIHLAHVIGTHHYRTVYTNLVSVAEGIAANAEVRQAQVLGTPGGFIHFQVDDFEYYREIANPNAVSPEPFLSAAARSLFDALWARSAYAFELVEPFATNPRDRRFPASRTWTRAGGDGPAAIRFTRARASDVDYDYALLTEGGTAIETGKAFIDFAARPHSTIELVSPVARRLGIYDIVSNELRLSLANPGTARPIDLSGASVYRTSQP